MLAPTVTGAVASMNTPEESISGSLTLREDPAATAIFPERSVPFSLSAAQVTVTCDAEVFITHISLRASGTEPIPGTNHVEASV